jgi:hypothetical protein
MFRHQVVILRGFITKEYKIVMANYMVKASFGDLTEYLLGIIP